MTRIPTGRGSMAIALLLTMLSAGSATASPGSSAPPTLASAPSLSSESADEADPAAQALERLEATLDRWSRSCRKPDSHGLCIAITPAAASKIRCDTPRLGRVKVADRRAKAARRAYEALGAAISETETLGPPADPALAPRYLELLARARIARADRDLERYLGLTMPADLDFFVEEWKKDSGIPKWEQEYEAQVARKERSMRRFKEYYEQKTELATSLREAYADQIDATLHLRPALGLRMALMAQHMADQLRSAFIPASLREPELQVAYCEALVVHAEPLEQQAAQAIEWCLEVASEHTLTGPAVDSCRALHERLAERTPPPAE